MSKKKKPVPKDGQAQKEKWRSHPRYVWEDSERLMSDLLWNLDVILERTQELDHDFKVDLLIRRIHRMTGSFHPIGVQLTQKKGDTKKALSFFEAARHATRGRLLYVEIHGPVTMNMAIALKAAITTLWLDRSSRRRRQFCVSVTSSGVFWWWSLTDLLESSEDKKNKRR